jgi:hypothetical protein
LWAVALLVLSVSPVTTPFATLDLIDLLGGRASHEGVLLQSKPAPDEPAAGLTASTSPQPQHGIGGPDTPWRAHPPYTSTVHHVPLRI